MQALLVWWAPMLQQHLIDEEAVLVKLQQAPILHCSAFARHGNNVKLGQGLWVARPGCVEVQGSGCYLQQKWFSLATR